MESLKRFFASRRTLIGASAGMIGLLCLVVLCLPMRSNAGLQFGPVAVNTDRIISAVEDAGLMDVFERGGPIMWPLLIASILALGTVIDRVMFLTRVRAGRDSKSVEKFLALAKEGNVESALAISERTNCYILQTLEYALRHEGKSLENALRYAQEMQINKFRRGIPILDTVITLAPLLGLLGTVTGMMGSFSLIGGELSAPGAITGGIAEALIATAFGLGIAITSLIPFNYLNTRLDKVRIEIESAATQLQLIWRSVPHLSTITLSCEDTLPEVETA